MDKLLVQTKELKPEFKRRNRLWNLFLRRYFLGFASIWKEHPLIDYLLTIDIELGSMKYYYFQHGFKYTRDKIMKYNLVIAERLEGKEVELNLKDFYIQTLLTDKEQVENQLSIELEELCLN